ncbi:hypothetical protein GCM10022240_28610 [Microbacterium kribbense]|uniref:DUF559 domain-containing protein n=1 Tax=Microbacterium kribbense TaxID=433645 RepID=A0ABP7GTV6_9MICO
MESLPYWMDGVAFTVAEGRAAGLTDARMRRPEALRPFHGLRVIGTDGRIDGGIIDRCTDLRVVLPRAAEFCGATAARLWGIPLPTELTDDVHVLVSGATAVRRPGVVGWTRAVPAAFGRIEHGLPVTSPADTWVMLAAMTAERGGEVSREWLVAIGDFLISGLRTKHGRDKPLATLAELEAAAQRYGSRRGAVKLRWALPRLRSPVDSPRETLLRVGLVAARLPEPVVQPAILTAAGVRHPDLGYLDERVLLEYLGDVHRVDKSVWRRDLTRVQLFQDAGYHVMLVGADDVAPEGMPALAQRVRRALHRTR